MIQHNLLCFLHKNTYADNWSLQPSSQYYGLASHTAHVVWERRNVGSERQIFEELFHAGLFTHRAVTTYIFRKNPSFTSNKPTNTLPIGSAKYFFFGKYITLILLFNSWTNWTLYGVIPRSICKISLNDVSEVAVV